MYTGKLAQVAKIMHATLIGDDKDFRGISTDSRVPQAQSLFFALKGANFDGHDFIEQAIEQGACAVVSSRKLIGVTVPILLVLDPLIALGDLAKDHLKECGSDIIAITGSCGKTTTKNLMAAIFAKTEYRYVASKKNFNNEFGLPLSLLELAKDDAVAIIEMGATKRGDIDYLCKIAQPLISIVTNIAPMHIEKFGSIENVALTKAEIYANLTAGGVAIVNADDQYFVLLKQVIDEVKPKVKVLTFGFNTDADFYPTYVTSNEQGSKFILHTPIGNIAIQLKLLGEHNILNALAAAAGAYAFVIGLAQILEGLESSEPVSQRLEKTVFATGVTLIDDTYNAGPKAACAALDVLATFPGKKIFILGDMLELGSEQIEIHKQIGLYAKDKQIDLMFTFGSLAKASALAFGNNAFSFEHKDILCEALVKELTAGTVILVKGSRGMKMESIVQFIAHKTGEIA